jgi:hypothetical protein
MPFGGVTEKISERSGNVTSLSVKTGNFFNLLVPIFHEPPAGTRFMSLYSREFFFL